MPSYLLKGRIAHPAFLRGEAEPAPTIGLSGARFAADGEKPLDLGDLWILPGFVDAHTHLASWGARRREVDLSKASSLREALARLSAAARRLPAGQWLVARGWDESQWPERRGLTREDLEKVSTCHPILAMRVDGHMATVNRRAEQELRLQASREGWLVEEQLETARAKLRAQGETRMQDILHGARDALREGITTIHEMCHREDLEAYRRLRDQGHLPIRVYAIAYWDAWPFARALESDDFLWTGGVKFYADGSLGARTALLREPYADAPQTRGRFFEDPDALRAKMRAAAEAGAQICAHAIGDAAIDFVLSVLRQLPPAPHRIEHAELLHPEHLADLRELGLIASMQPNFIAQWGQEGGLYAQRLGARFRTMNPLRRLHEQGIRMAFGSDTMPLSAALVLQGASDAPFPDQRLPRNWALWYFTAGSADATPHRPPIGRLQPGYLADFTIWDGLPPDGALLATIVAGQVRYATEDLRLQALLEALPQRIL